LSIPALRLLKHFSIEQSDLPRQFQRKNVLPFKPSCQVVNAIDVAVAAADAWVDVSPLLPSVLTDADTLALLNQLMATSVKKWSNNAQVRSRDAHRFQEKIALLYF
jgi:hypothetical protein